MLSNEIKKQIFLMSCAGWFDSEIKANLVGRRDDDGNKFIDDELYQAVMVDLADEVNAYIEECKPFCEAYWTNLARQYIVAGVGDVRINSSVWSAVMAQKFGWKQKSEVEHTGSVELIQRIKSARERVFGQSNGQNN